LRKRKNLPFDGNFLDKIFLQNKLFKVKRIIKVILRNVVSLKEKLALLSLVNKNVQNK